MAFASYEISRSITGVQRPGSSVARSVASETRPMQTAVSVGYSESAQYLQELVSGMLAWKTFVTAIKIEPDNIEKEIITFLPPKKHIVIQAHVHRVQRPSILITDDDKR
jgi:hypothetical protein